MLATLLVSALTSVASVKLTGTLRWQINGGDITIYAGSVNNSAKAATGDVRLEVWAFTTPYKGQALNGYIIGTYDMGQLAGKQKVSNIAVSVPYAKPGTYNGDAYYTTMFVYEYKNGAWAVDSYYTFNSTVPLDSGYDGGLSQGATGSLIQYVGNVSYYIYGYGVTLSANEIENANSSYKLSGTLRMQLWATTTPYTGGTINGYVLGQYTIGQLGHGNNYFNLANTVPYYTPPYGNYYLTLVLEMYNNGGYGIINYVNFSGLHTL